MLLSTISKSDTDALSTLFVAVVLGYLCLNLMGTAVSLTGTAALLTGISSALAGAASWYMQWIWSKLDTKPTE